MNSLRALQSNSMRRAGVFACRQHPAAAMQQSRAYMQQSSTAAATKATHQQPGDFDEPSLLSLLEASTTSNTPSRAQPDFDQPSLLSLLEASSVPNISSLDSAEYIIADDQATNQPVFKQVSGGKPKSNPIFKDTIPAADH